MDKKIIDSMDETLKEKLMNCRDEAEMRKVLAESGMELNDDLLDAVAGGGEWTTFADGTPFFCVTMDTI